LFMTQISITSPWRARRRLFQPGVYLVPSELSALEARCCVADGAGSIVTEAVAIAEPFREPKKQVEEQLDQKQPAPENKGRGAAPENKSPVEDGDRRGDGAESHSASRKRNPRAKRPSGE
jgi:hypothetical protein